jgi:hypothetical protein
LCPLWGVLIALAIFDLGPRASAAYLTVADSSSLWDELPADAADDSDRSPDHNPRIEPGALPHQQPGGSTTSSPTSGPGGDNPNAGLPPLAETPSPGLVAYLREQSRSLDPSHFVASILDPPRTV